MTNCPLLFHFNQARGLVVIYTRQELTIVAQDMNAIKVRDENLSKIVSCSSFRLPQFGALPSSVIPEPVDGIAGEHFHTFDRDVCDNNVIIHAIDSHISGITDFASARVRYKCTPGWIGFQKG